MKVSELPKYLKLLPPAQAVLIVGPPGCGKSTAVREFAESEASRLGRQFVDYDDDNELFLKISTNPERYYVFLDLRLSECEPTDFLGVPRDSDGFIVYKPLRWVQAFSHQASAGLIFLDEITNVRREDVLAQAYKLVLDRRVGFKKLSDGVRVIAAGNRPEHSSIANLLPAPLTNRFAVLDIDASDPYEWIEYVNSKEGGIDPRVAGYITRFPSDLHREPDATETLENFPTRRSWSRLNQVLRDNEIKDVREIKEVAEMLVGSFVAQKFSAFCLLQKYLPPPDRILKDPDVIFGNEVGGEDIKRLDLLYYAIASVASFASTCKVDPKALVNFAVKLAKAHADLFVVFVKLLPKEVRNALVVSAAKVKEVQEAVAAVSRYL